MKRLILMGVLIMAVILISSCQSGTTGAVVVCNSPYIRHGMACCLDVNENNICDNDEGVVLKQTTVEEEETEEEEDEEETEDEEESDTVSIPELTAKIEGFEDFDIVIPSGEVDEDTIKMAIKLAALINYKSDILPKDQFDITDYHRIYLIKKKNETISSLDEYIIAVGDEAPAKIVFKAEDLAEGIGYIGDIKKTDNIDFSEYERAIFLVIESSS